MPYDLRFFQVLEDKHMVNAYDVPADKIISRLGDVLKEKELVNFPDWAQLVKTGIHKEKPPENDDWWYIRSAAILRKIYTKGPIGGSRLQAEFGGFRDRGSKPNKAAKGSGKVIRAILQQLEASKLVKTLDKTGRIISPTGQKLMDHLAKEIMDELAVENPELTKY